MVPRANYVLMVVLTVVLLAGVTVLAMPGPKVKAPPSDVEISALINRLGSDDADVVHDARHDLIVFGKDVLPKLTLALQHENKQIRDQAKRTIDVLEGRKTEAEMEP